MSIRHLERLFRPRSVALIGASAQPGTVGSVVLRNLLDGGFAGPILPVNPKYRELTGLICYPSVDALAEAPDLAVICTPAATIPGLIEGLGRKGCRAALVISSGLADGRDASGLSLQEAMLGAARRFGLRILGPNCVGAVVPAAGLNASFAARPAHPGQIAFISQSGALCASVLDWAWTRGIGFSSFVSLGDGVDIDFGDVVDYLGSDPQTRSILLYIESIRSRRSFMSATRAAARNKPVLCIKAGRFAEGARAARSHTGALAGADDVFDAAIRRAGVLRVYSVDELFAAVETLAAPRLPSGERIAILTNGGGLGVLATDALMEKGGKLAALGADTVAALDRVLPSTWSKGNPIDVIGDASAERYGAAARVLAQAPEVDAVLALYSPTALVSPEAVAAALVAPFRGARVCLLTSWVGGDLVKPARKIFSGAGIPTYETPELAVTAMLHITTYRRNQALLQETPPPIPTELTPDRGAARQLVEAAVLEAEDVILSEPRAKDLLAAYGIDVVRTRTADTPQAAGAIAAEIGFPVALKILSPDITHKTDVGGVVLFLSNAQAVQAAAVNMIETVKRQAPSARLHGFTIQTMAQRPGAFELIVGVANDPLFGPAILFGQGGTAVEVVADRAVGLPPLNMLLARDLVARTRVSKLLAGYRGRAPADLDAVCSALMRVSQMIIDIPELIEMDINPLLVDDKGVLALDARVRLRRASAGADRRLAIRPYPRELEERFTLRSGRSVVIRPIRPEDEPEHRAFHAHLTPEDIRSRYFGLIPELPHSQLARYTQIDYDREMAFIATAPRADGKPETLGVIRTIADPDNDTAEYAIVVRSDIKGQGLGLRLLKKMIDYCRARGTRRLVGQVLADNIRMLQLTAELGFAVAPIPGENAVETSLLLNR